MPATALLPPERRPRDEPPDAREVGLPPGPQPCGTARWSAPGRPPGPRGAAPDRPRAAAPGADRRRATSCAGTSSSRAIRRVGPIGVARRSPTSWRMAPRTACGRRMAAAARAPNTSPSSSELLASRLAPCTPVQATSPAANSLGDRCAAVEVGVHAAAHVVRGRADRQARRARGRARRRGRSRRCRGIAHAPRPRRDAPATDTPAPGPRRLADHRRGDDVARRQLAARVVPRHEALAVGVQQPGAFAAHRLPETRKRGRPGTCRTVGWNCTNSRSPSRAPARHAMARPSPRGDGRIGGLGEDLSRASSRQQHARSVHGDAAAVAVDDLDAVDGAVRRSIKTRGQCVIEDHEIRGPVQTRPQRSRDLASGGVAARGARA